MPHHRFAYRSDRRLATCLTGARISGRVAPSFGLGQSIRQTLFKGPGRGLSFQPIPALGAQRSSAVLARFAVGREFHFLALHRRGQLLAKSLSEARACSICILAKRDSPMKRSASR